MAKPVTERPVCEGLLIVLLILYAIFGIGIITYGVIQEQEGDKAGLEPMLNKVGIERQQHMFYATGAFSIFTCTCFIIGLCLSPKWGCWFLVGCLFLLVSIALNIYLVCTLLINFKYDWGVEEYLSDLSYADPKGKLIWDKLQTQYQCCGVHDEDEWDMKPTTCPEIPDDDTAQHGCYYKFVESRKHNTLVVSIVLIFTIIIEVK